MISHVLSGCKFSLADGRHLYRHNAVLRCIVNGIARLINNLKNKQSGKQRKLKSKMKIQFVKEGETPKKSPLQKVQRGLLLDGSS